MAEPLETNQIVFIVPLILVLVQQFSSLSREIADSAGEYSDTSPLLSPESAPTDSRRWLRIPQLGRLNYLHTTNMLLLAGAFALILATETGIIKNILGLVVLLVWLQLPLLEIDEYGEIREEGGTPLELYLHIAGVAFTAVYLVITPIFEPGKLISKKDIFSSELVTWTNDPEQLLGIASWVGLVLFTSLAFLIFFEKKVNKIAESKGDG